MERRQFTFLILLVILLYLSYKVISHEYNAYIEDKFIESRNELINNIKTDIEYANSLISYKKSSAYKNKILKEQQGLKMKGEELIIITLEDQYNKYIYKQSDKNSIEDLIPKEKNPIDDMSNYEKWIYLIFKKEPNS